MKQFDEMYFVVHSSDPRFPNRQEEPVKVLGLRRLSDLVISRGLVNWLITKRKAKTEPLLTRGLLPLPQVDRLKAKAQSCGALRLIKSRMPVCATTTQT